MRRGWVYWGGGSTHIPGNRLDEERSKCAGWGGMDWAGAQAPAQAWPRGAQSILASSPSSGAKGQSREASLQPNYLGSNLKDIPIACEAVCQVWYLFVSVFISQRVSFSAPQGTGWMQALAFSWNKN